MLKSTIQLSVIAVIVLLLVAIPSQLWFNNENFHIWLNQHLSNNLSGAISLFVLLTILMTIGLPRQIAAFVSGYCFSFNLGFMLATLAATLACYLTVSLSRRFLTTWINKKYAHQQNTIYHFLSEQLFYKAIIIRILPIGSNFLTNIIAGVCQLNKTHYVSGSFIGFMPQMVIFSLAGSGVKLASSTHLLASGILFLIALIMSFWLYQRHKK